MRVKLLRGKDAAGVLLVYPSTLGEYGEAIEAIGRRAAAGSAGPRSADAAYIVTTAAQRDRWGLPDLAASGRAPMVDEAEAFGLLAGGAGPAGDPDEPLADPAGTAGELSDTETGGAAPSPSSLSGSPSVATTPWRSSTSRRRWASPSAARRAARSCARRTATCSTRRASTSPRRARFVAATRPTTPTRSPTSTSRITLWAVQPRPNAPRSSFFPGDSRIPDPAASRNRTRVRSVGCQIGCQISDGAERRIHRKVGLESRLGNGGQRCSSSVADSLVAGS